MIHVHTQVLGTKRTEVLVWYAADQSRSNHQYRHFWQWASRFAILPMKMYFHLCEKFLCNPTNQLLISNDKVQGLVLTRKLERVPTEPLLEPCSEVLKLKRAPAQFDLMQSPP